MIHYIFFQQTKNKVSTFFTPKEYSLPPKSSIHCFKWYFCFWHETCL